MPAAADDAAFGTRGAVCGCAAVTTADNPPASKLASTKTMIKRTATTGFIKHETLKTHKKKMVCIVSLAP